MISPEFTTQSLTKLIQQEWLGDLTWTLLGFSQGGFFAPVFVKAGLSCKKIIVVGAAYWLEAYEGLSNLEKHGIHGEKDLIVGFEYSQASFQALKEQGIGKKIFSLPRVGRTLKDSGRKIIRDLLSSKWKGQD
jgi:predicted esterase